QRVPAVDVDDLAGDPTGIGADQEPRQTGDVFGLAHILHRRVLDVAAVHVAVARHAFHDLGADETGTNGVEADASRAVLVSGVADHLFDAGLTDGVGTEVRVRHVTGD